MRGKGQTITNELQKLIERAKALGYKEHWIRLTKEYVNELQQRGVYCVDKFVRRLKRSTIGKDKREYWDILMEGRFAVILTRNKFSRIHIEYSDKGPDIKADWNKNTVYFEVMRRRFEVDEWAEESRDALPPPDKTENITDRIQDEIRKLQIGKINILVFWSDTVKVLKLDMEKAFKYIQQVINENPGMYKKLSGILFTEGGGVDVTTQKQFCLFPNDKASKPLGTRLAKKLDYLNEKSSKQLKRERERWTAILKRN